MLFKFYLLAETASSFAWVSLKLDKKDWISVLKTSFSRLENEPEMIKATLPYLDKTVSIHDLEDYLLELLEQHDPNFVKKWKAEKETPNTENKESE